MMPLSYQYTNYLHVSFVAIGVHQVLLFMHQQWENLKNTEHRTCALELQGCLEQADFQFPAPISVLSLQLQG